MSDERRDDTRPRAATSADEESAAGRFAASLRSRFADPPPGAAASDDCPDPTRIWDAAHGEPRPDVVAALVDHVAACAPCTVAWRIAREDARSATHAVGGRPARGRGGWTAGIPGGWMGLAAAAILLVAVGGLAIRAVAPKFLGSSDPGIRLRSPSDREIVSLVPENTPLPRSACVLRWSSAGKGARYRIEVTDERLEPVAESRGFEGEEYRVPEESLVGIPKGARILWRIEAERPDGWKASSSTFTVLVE